MIMYVLNLFTVYNLELFYRDKAIISLVLIISVPLIFGHIISKEKSKKLLLSFILIGVLISFFSSLLRVFVLDMFALKLIYSNSNVNLVDTMTFLDRIIEFSKFFAIGSSAFTIIGLIKFSK